MMTSVSRALENSETTGTLSLRGHGLQLFPDVEGYTLDDVVDLDISRNKFAAVPSMLTFIFPELEHLDCSSNVVTSVPDFATLTCLTSLDLSRNLLEVLPMHMLNLPGLKILRLSGNRLKQLPESVDILTGCVELDVSKNMLTTLPNTILTLQLQTLSVASNNIAALPEKIGRLKSLISLDISDNKINRLPGSLKYLRSLEVLAVESNPIVEPPPNICARGRVQIIKWLESKAEEDHHSKHNPAAEEDVWSAHASGGRASTESGNGNHDHEHILGDDDFNHTFQPYRSQSRTSLDTSIVADLPFCPADGTLVEEEAAEEAVGRGGAAAAASAGGGASSVDDADDAGYLSVSAGTGDFSLSEVDVDAPSSSYTALYPYEPRSPLELNLVEGEVVMELEHDAGDGWTRVKGRNGDGLVPTTYIQLYTPHGPAGNQLEQDLERSVRHEDAAAAAAIAAARALVDAEAAASAAAVAATGALSTAAVMQSAAAVAAQSRGASDSIPSYSRSNSNSNSNSHSPSPTPPPSSTSPSSFAAAADATAAAAAAATEADEEVAAVPRRPQRQTGAERQSWRRTIVLEEKRLLEEELKKTQEQEAASRLAALRSQEELTAAKARAEALEIAQRAHAAALEAENEKVARAAVEAAEAERARVALEADERERALEARLIAIEEREAQTKAAEERSRNALAEAKARAESLEEAQHAKVEAIAAAAEAERRKAEVAAEERERALEARLAEIEAREAQTRAAEEESRKQLVEAKARADALEWSMQQEANAAKEQAMAAQAKEDAVKAEEVAEAVEQQHVLEEEERKRGREDAERHARASLVQREALAQQQRLEEQFRNAAEREAKSKAAEQQIRQELEEERRRTAAAAALLSVNVKREAAAAEAEVAAVQGTVEAARAEANAAAEMLAAAHAEAETEEAAEAAAFARAELDAAEATAAATAAAAAEAGSKARADMEAAALAKAMERANSAAAAAAALRTSAPSTRTAAAALPAPRGEAPLPPAHRMLSQPTAAAAASSPRGVAPPPPPSLTALQRTALRRKLLAARGTIAANSSPGSSRRRVAGGGLPPPRTGSTPPDRSRRRSSPWTAPSTPPPSALHEGSEVGFPAQNKDIVGFPAAPAVPTRVDAGSGTGKPNLAPKPQVPPGRWAEIISRQRVKLHGLRATAQLPIDGLLRPVQRDGTGTYNGAAWGHTQLQAHQAQRARAYDSMMTAQTLRLEQAPEPENVVLATLMHRAALASRRTFGKVVRVPALILKDLVELPPLPPQVTRADLEEFVDPGAVDMVLGQYKHLEVCLKQLESAFNAPVATLASPFDLPRCLADGVILCKLLELTGARDDAEGSDDDVDSDGRWRIYRESGNSPTKPPRGISGESAVARDKLANLSYLRAKKNVVNFVTRATRRNVMRFDAERLSFAVLNAQPSPELSALVSVLIP